MRDLVFLAASFTALVAGAAFTIAHLESPRCLVCRRPFAFYAYRRCRRHRVRQ